MIESLMHVNARLSSELSFNEDIMQRLNRAAAVFSLLAFRFLGSAQTLGTSRLAEVSFAAHRGGSNEAAFGCLMENNSTVLKTIMQSDRSSGADGQNGGRIEKRAEEESRKRK